MSARPLSIALTLSAPILFGYVPLGMAFGVVFSAQLDYAWWVAPLMGLVIYSGATQLLAVSLLLASTGLMEAFIALLLLNTRHLFYGLSLLEHFRAAGWRKPYLIFALTDETYSLMASRPRGPDRRHEQQVDFFINLLSQSYWILGSALGAWLGHVLVFDATGIEFALVALFIVLCIEQYKVLQSGFPIFIGTLAGLVAVLLLPQNHQLAMAILLVCLVLLGQYRLNQRGNISNKLEGSP